MSTPDDRAPCEECGQTMNPRIGGEYHCKTCGMPRLHDAEDAAREDLARVCQEIEEALSAIHPGARYADRDDCQDFICYAVSIHDDSLESYPSVHIHDVDVPRAKAEAHLIANAPTYLRTLLDALKRSATELAVELREIEERHARVRPESDVSVLLQAHRDRATLLRAVRRQQAEIERLRDIRSMLQAEIERLREEKGHAWYVGHAVGLEKAQDELADLRARAERAESVRLALVEVLRVIEIAGGPNRLMEAVQLGAVSWFHKMEDAIRVARARIDDAAIAEEGDR